MSSPTTLTTANNAAACVAELANLAWDQVADADLVTAVATVGRMRASLDATLVQLTDRLVATGAAEAAGWASAKDFLTHALGGRKGTGGSLVRVAAQTSELPRVREAMATGGLSFAQAGVLAGRVRTLPQHQELRTAAADAMLALVEDEGIDATDLDRRFPDIVQDLDPDGALIGADLDRPKAERGAHLARYLSFTPDHLGGVRIRGYATIEDTELVKTTLLPLAAPVITEPGACGGDPTTLGTGGRDEQGRRVGHGCPDPVCGHDGTDPRDAGARLWDALVDACGRLQATDTLPHAHGTTARITLTLPYQQLAEQAGNGMLPSGDRLSAAAVRRLACDAEIIPAVLGTQTQVLDLGRTTRLVTTGLWHALVLRDQHCTFPGCTRLPITCDAHHIIHWADGGPTNLDNLLLLCRRHHTLTHQTPWQVQLDPTTRQPAWTPPPPIDDRDRFTYIPAQRPPPLVA